MSCEGSENTFWIPICKRAQEPSDKPVSSSYHPVECGFLVYLSAHMKVGLNHQEYETVILEIFAMLIRVNSKYLVYYQICSEKHRIGPSNS